MRSDTATVATTSGSLATGTWQLDPARSSVEFHVPHLYGLITVKGRFDRYQGTLNLSAHPAVELLIEADSVNTRKKKRDEHLRSDDFFDAARHPQVRFEADTATLDGDTLTARGTLQAAGKQIPLDVVATIRPAGDGFEIEASTVADHRELGMTLSPLGITRTPTRLIVRGHLARVEDAR
jgi:polyisoprenoid-binding protein YceI